MGRRENSLEQIIDKLLHGALGGEQPGQVDLGDQLVGPLVLVVVRVMTHQMPHLNTCTKQLE